MIFITRATPKVSPRAHRILEGYLLTLKLFFDTDFEEATVFQTLSDWVRAYGPLDVQILAVVSGRPVVADELHRWSERDLGAVINESYGL